MKQFSQFKRSTGACPIGWHLPSDAEWTQLTDYLGGANVAGGKLKATTHWDSPNTGATNESGFTALPGGLRYTNGTFYYIGVTSRWWSFTEDDTDIAFFMFIDYYSGNAIRGDYNKALGISVRCVKDFVLLKLIINHVCGNKVKTKQEKIAMHIRLSNFMA
ncbi:MAG TPA: hypothetical protein ENN45_03275 [Bacteroidetes bacterium]|nr:hypothetical protein [Bacteroidota bacterium]